MDRLEADVCVVGAGYAGLTAAPRLTRAGLTRGDCEGKSPSLGTYLVEVRLELSGVLPVDDAVSVEIKSVPGNAVRTERTIRN